MRAHLSYANVMATIAVFIALGGSSYAALVITSKQVKNNSLTGQDLKDGSVSGRDVKDGSLLSRDFALGQLPAGPQGPQGEAGPAGAMGPPGPKGETGTVDTSSFYDKSAADARFVRGRTYQRRYDLAEGWYLAPHGMQVINIACERGDLLLDGGYRLEQNWDNPSQVETDERLERDRYRVTFTNYGSETRYAYGVHAQAICLEIVAPDPAP